MSGLGALAAEASDMDVLRRNFIDYFTGHPERADEVQPHLDLFRPNGTWSDIDYASQRRSGWPTCNHLRRILEMARLYRSPDHPLAGSDSLRKAIAMALDHWLEHDYQNANWWNARIGVPMAVAPTLILMGNDLSEATRSRAIELLLERSKMGMTGQNKVWVVGIAFMKGICSPVPRKPGDPSALGTICRMSPELIGQVADAGPACPRTIPVFCLPFAPRKRAVLDGAVCFWEKVSKRTGQTSSQEAGQ